jgi:predicted Zn-dependent protease
MRKQFGLLIVLILLLPIAGCAALDVEQGGFNLISLDEEWSMRDEMIAQVQQEYTLVTDGRSIAYLNQLGRQIVAQTKLGNRQWTFGIVDDPGVNAFNLPGGVVFVNRGLIQRAETLDQFTAVLGHEIAHGVARHGTQMMTRSMGIQVLSGLLLGNDAGERKRILGGLVTSGVLSDYGRDAERESDQLGIGFAHAANFDPKGSIQMFEMLLSLRQSQPNSIAQFFSSHPLTEERIRRARTLAAQLPDTGSLVHDTQAYRDFRKRNGG